MPVVKNISYFLTAMVFAKGMGFLQAFVVAKILGPANFGVWVTLMLVVSYSPIVSLGTVETLLKQVPYFLGRNSHARVREVEGAVIGSLILSAAVFVGIAFAAPFLTALTSVGFEPFFVVVVALTIAVSCFSAYFYHRFAAYENFKATGSMDFLRGVVALICIGGMAWGWGLSGAVVGYSFHEAIMCVVLSLVNVRAYGGVRPSFRRDLLLNAVRVGFPITLLWWSLALTGSVDRVVLGGLLGSEAVGYFGLGISVTSLLALLPMVVGRVLYPRVNRRVAETPGSEAMKQVVIAPTLALSTLLVNLQVVLLVAMPFLYTWILPKYRPGLLAGQILVVGSFFACLLRNGANYLIADNQERVFLFYIAGTLISTALFDVSLVKTGFGIEGVALGTSLAGLLLTTLVWRRVLKSLGFASRRAWAVLVGLYLPHMVLVVAVVCLRLIYHSSFQTLDLFTGLICCVVLLVSINAALFCFPWHRREMLGWLTAIGKVNRSILTSAGVRFAEKN